MDERRHRLERPKHKPDGTFARGVASNPKGANGIPVTATEKQEFRRGFHIALDATPKAVRKLIRWMDHGETFAQQFQAVDRLLSLVEKVCIRQSIDLNLTGEVHLSESVNLDEATLEELADRWGQMIGATGHEPPMFDVTPSPSRALPTPYRGARSTDRFKERIEAARADLERFEAEAATEEVAEPRHRIVRRRRPR